MDQKLSLSFLSTQALDHGTNNLFLFLDLKYHQLNRLMLI